MDPIFYPGAPPAALIGNEGQVCYDNSVLPYSIYVRRSGSWVLTGAGGTGGNLTTPVLTRPLISVTTVAALPAAAAGNKGTIAVVSDLATSIVLGLGLTAAGSGGNCSTVLSTGSDWVVI